MSEVERNLSFLDAKADRWMAEQGVQEMIASATEVFAKYSSPDIMERFREQIRRLARNAYVEGAHEAWADVAARRLSAPLQSTTLERSP